MTRFPVLVALALCTTGAFAQSSSTYDTPQGPLTVHSSQPGPRDYGPPPAFAQLDRRGAGSISADDAEAYPPLANDFIHADANRDGRVSRSEYERWAKSSH